MNVDFLASVNKTSGTQFNPANSPKEPAQGFREQLNSVMRDNERRNETVAGKNPAAEKTQPAAAKAKAGEKPNAPENSGRAEQKFNADNETDAAQTTDYAQKTSEETSGTYDNAADQKFTSDAEDSGSYGESESDETPEADNIYGLAPPSAETSETDNIYVFTPPFTEISETGNGYAPESRFAGTQPPVGFSDFSVSDSADADARIFPPATTEDDSGFAEMVKLKAVLENAASAAGLNAAEQAGSGARSAVAAEAVPADAAKPAAAPAPSETADGNTQQNASFSVPGAENETQELLAAVDGETEPDVKLTDTESARADVKDVPQNELFRKTQEMTHVSDGNASAASVPARAGSARNEAPPKTETQTEADQPEFSNKTAANASLEDEDILTERAAARAVRPRVSSAFVNSSENAGKTVQAAETFVQAASGAAKADAPATANSVSASDQEFVVELAGRIQAQIRGGREMIRIQLHPEELGKLEIRAESVRGGIIARIAAESADVKKLLESNIQNLQQALESRGLKVDRLHIVVEETANSALYAEGGRYGNSGTGSRDASAAGFSGFNGAENEELSPDEDAGDLSAAAARRGVGFYTVA